MAKAMIIRSDYKKAEIIGNWMIKFNDPKQGKKRLEKAEQLCVINGMKHGELSTIINGNFSDYSYNQLVEINKIINKKKLTK